jgi:CubicO group peptidase (beta-lactamase class C family)
MPATAPTPSPAAIAALSALTRQAVLDGVTPGGVVLVGKDGRDVLCHPFGDRQRDPVRHPATADTVYDLASLTKALCTSVLCARAVGRGTLAFDEPIVPTAAAGASGHAAITARLALAHATGWPAHRPFHERASGRDAILAHVLREPLVHAPGTRSLYSDLGFIALGAWLERRLGAPLDHLFSREIARPLGLDHLRFGPWGDGDADLAPTERCPVRGRLLHGEVHDLNTWAMGGVAGHAGLFGRARDVGVLAHALIAAYHGIGAPTVASLVAQDTLRELWAPAGIPGSTWRLGWDGPAPTGSLAGTSISRRAVGHLGFTGCSLWIDPDRACFVLVLMNRVHPTVRDDPRLRALRSALNDAALSAVSYEI